MAAAPKRATKAMAAAQDEPAGLRNGLGFSPGQARQVETMAAAMGMTDSPLLAQLRARGGKPSG